MMGLRYKAGLFLIGAVVFIWVTSAEVTQRIFVQYKQPFVLTYLGISLLVIYLPIAALKDWIYRFLATKSFTDLFRNSSVELDTPLITNRMHPSLELISDINLSRNEEGLWPLLDKNGEGEKDLSMQNWELSSWEIAKRGFLIAPVWFTTEYLSSAALAKTSVASTTVLSSTSGLFTLFFGAYFGQETLNATKIIAVFISMAGVVMTTLGKTWAADESLSISGTTEHSILGDIYGLLAALAYGLFTVLLKKSIGSNEEKVDVQKLFGYIGLFTLFGLWWLGSVATDGCWNRTPLQISSLNIHRRSVAAKLLSGECPFRLFLGSGCGLDESVGCNFRHVPHDTPGNGSRYGHPWTSVFCSLYSWIPSGILAFNCV
ncbi:hypothetical protein GIB67_014029 [Kingdonia uniflora]|uniref:EamA domain-containing protein n=1 Tax=Kingdonia uniflora TaxID=39325 RepID=A0A7J7L5P8_9MAGN|nr:hypothetical protein GIB67_014029 [Kingdonia uniflora]